MTKDFSRVRINHVKTALHRHEKNSENWISDYTTHMHVSLEIFFFLHLNPWYKRLLHTRMQIASHYLFHLTSAFNMYPFSYFFRLWFHVSTFQCIFVIRSMCGFAFLPTHLDLFSRTKHDQICIWFHFFSFHLLHIYILLENIAKSFSPYLPSTQPMHSSRSSYWSVVEVCYCGYTIWLCTGINWGIVNKKYVYMIWIFK